MIGLSPYAARLGEDEDGTVHDGGMRHPAMQDYSFKLMRKNQYEEALFRCEDDR